MCHTNLLVQNNKTIITNTHIGNTCDMYTSHLRHIHDLVILSQDRRYVFHYFVLSQPRASLLAENSFCL